MAGFSSADRALSDAFRTLAQTPFSTQTTEAIMRVVREPHQRRGYAAPGIERDIAYGPDPRQRLDVHYDPEAVNQQVPVLVWVPGGGFVFSTKWQPGTPHWDNIGAWARRNHAIAVIIDYRLAPQYTWPVAAGDLASAIEWVRQNIIAYGGDPNRIVLAGASSGAAHVASFVAGHGGDPGSLAGVVVVSGIYAPASVTEAPLSILVGKYYGVDHDELRARSSVPGLAAWPGPLLVTVAEFDPATLQQQALLLLAERFQARGALPYFAVDPGHLHASDVFSLGIDDSALDLMMRRLLAEVTS
ncbi:alpha/beta hydrolase [Paenarthrobacter aromaticivorans]|uniref:Alpha/beta hydrolase n=1 Tax=Paenarthrobacter aromaticivorans TaxID=2849150 RepID=A0ABS6I750_9MICC|nr:alpha/beta hydrolase [Paenarthrobacter sp. MMS21-TAE1-1]MBU8867543.1 alpha/beta hydrolase [Paenarthrobacter sp. MMS21-TAE1-1]